MSRRLAVLPADPTPLTLDAIAKDPARAAELTPAARQALLLQLAGVLLALGAVPAPEPVKDGGWLTVEEVAELLRLSKPYIYELARKGLPCVRHGRYIRIPKDKLDEWTAALAR